jgi:hypothetical protein
MKQLLVLAVLAGALGPGCYSIVDEVRTQQIRVASRPTGAYIRQTDRQGIKDLGQAPVVVNKQYTVQVKRFRHWHWIWPALFGVCTGVGFGLMGEGGGGDEPSPGLIAGSLCAIGFVPTAVVDIVLAARSGKEVPPKPEPVQFTGFLQGHHPRSTWTPVPGPKSELRIDLAPAAMARRRPWPPARARATQPVRPQLRPRVLPRSKPQVRPVQPPALPGPTPSGPKPRQPIVAVFQVADAAGRLSEQELSQLTEYLAAELTKTGAYRVVPHKALQDQLVESKKGSYKQCYDEACQIELGKAVAAEKSLATKLLQVGRTCAISSTLYDLKTETAERAASVRTDCSVDRLMEGMEQVAQQLSRPSNR